MPLATDSLASLAVSASGPAGVITTFLLFAIPTGAGIPAGVLLGQRTGLTAVAMSGLYIGSGLLRAVLFEPLFRWMARRGRDGGRIARLQGGLRAAITRHSGISRTLRGAWAPVVVSYNLDPMAGRVAAAAAGIGWLRGWVLSLLADFFYFVSAAVPTLWIQRWVGNPWITLLLVALLSTAVPLLWRRLRAAAA